MAKLKENYNDGEIFMAADINATNSEVNKKADKSEIPEVMEWKAGDIFALTWGAYMGGIVTSGTKECAITVPLGAPIRARSATVTGNVILRGGQGYIDNMDSGKGIPLQGGDYEGMVQIINAKAGLVKINVKKKSAAFENVVNNTPVMMGTATEPQLTITFA
jgi:hypothetical protein